jgi:hypothetical protein
LAHPSFGLAAGNNTREPEGKSAQTRQAAVDQLVGDGSNARWAARL